MKKARHLAGLFVCNATRVNVQPEKRRGAEMGRSVFLAVLLIGGSVQAEAADREHWIPDSATVARIESYARTHMPVRDESDKAEPLDSYARFYTGMTLKGRKTVFGEYVLGRIGYPVGVHIVPWDKVPGISDGGCSIVDLWYDVLSAHMVQIGCHGIA